MTEGADSYLYSLSNIALKAVDTSDFLTAGSLLLPSPEKYYGIYY